MLCAEKSTSLRSRRIKQVAKCWKSSIGSQLERKTFTHSNLRFLISEKKTSQSINCYDIDSFSNCTTCTAINSEEIGDAHEDILKKKRDTK